MRAIDLTPPEAQRGGERAPGRTGALPYVLLAGLALALALATATALTSKQVSDREADVARLEQELAATRAKAEQLRPFADFRAVQESRASTIESLAKSRFDWDRVLRELSLVLPSDVWLVNLTGTVLPGVTVENAASISTRGEVQGPALEIVGCAPGQDAVAGFVAALEDIDGVTRVGLASSALGEETGSTAGSNGDDCRTRAFISRFEIVVAFDAVPVPEGATEPPLSVPGPLTAPEDPTQLAQASTAEQTGQAQRAVDELLPGG